VSVIQAVERLVVLIPGALQVNYVARSVIERDQRLIEEDRK